MTKPQHVKRHSGMTRALLIGLGVAIVVAGGGVATVFALRSSGSSASAAGAVGGASGANATTSTTKAPLVVDPADGATNVVLGSAVSVSADQGRLISVSVMSPSGQLLAGTMDPSGLSWRSTGKLLPSATYTVTVDGTNAKGRPTHEVSHFDSQPPTAVLTATIFPNSGLTVGIGQPIAIRFNHPVANKTDLLSLLHVTMSNPVTGGWYWFSDRELHFRPQAYWPTGEQVSLTANLTNFDAGNGIWATADNSTKFTVGDAHISTANVQSHTMTVTSNGATVATYPISAGRSKYPTMNGTHINLGKQQDVHMVSSSVGIPVNSPDGYDEHVFWDVLITDSGEYVHAAPWSTGAQGNSNVSHGCINLSPANATSFYNFSRIGDIIIVTGSPRPASTGDHGTMDWTVPFEKYTPATTA